ncbi:tetratricopeptide repeat protein [Floridanema evergladense]|uniref:Tetratricopeptide repeat protein n=1 Tax=Floridaenema evergladense BLCC-F167 TaxID=3153639 RepID=A0ABV4WP73_9CYAN
MSLPAVLHPDVVDFLRTNKEEYLKASAWECIDKLKQQQFDGGLRVKKLKGIAKKVWEARVTKAIRLIFTYNKSRQPETGNAEVYIAVQDICLDHDDVSRRAARNKTPDSEWLNAELVEVIGSLENDFITSEEELVIKEAQAEEWQINSDFTDELLGNIQWRVIDSELEWQRAIIQQDADLPLKLTPEEYELVNLYGNLLLSGSAGTGKTTVGLYRLLKSLEILPDGKRLYVAYNPILLKEAQKQFKRLISGSNADIESIFHFKTIRDLCLDILSVTGQNYFPEDEVTYQIFEQLYRPQSYQPYPPALVWDEIRSIIKGAHLETSSYQLSQKQYEQLGKKRSSVIPQKDRYKAYKVAEWYQGLLKKEGRFDEIDLARKVLQLIWQGKGTRYQLIVCDEVQDFSELQLELLVRLITPGGQLFFAGDLHQMISPSGFRWEDLKTKFFKGQREATQKTLNFNFRSVGSLVNLANQILKLRYRLLQERIADIGQPSSSYGECARLISAPLETLQPTLGQLNPDDAILVRTDADKQRFSQEFQSSFVFTIEEAKGLEFDTVFLVEFFKPRQSLWNKVLSSKPSLNKTDEPELRLELNLLYVAVTRARRILNIWETKLSAVWNQSELVSFLQLVHPDIVTKNRVDSTKKMWHEKGLDYLKAELYQQAIECFVKSGNTELKQLATAKLLTQKREYNKAVEIFTELQEWLEVARIFERQKQWLKAVEKYNLAGFPEKAAECKAFDFKQKGQFMEAAKQYELAGKPEEAEKCRKETEKRYTQFRKIQFPTNFSMGNLYIHDINKPISFPYTEWHEFGQAKGNITVPARKYLKLEVSWEASQDLSPLSTLNSDALHTLILRGTEVNDEGLVYIEGLTDLQELDLWDTQVTDAGLVNLANLKYLQVLHLYEISDVGLEHLQRLENLKVIKLHSNSNISGAFIRIGNLTEINVYQELEYIEKYHKPAKKFSKNALLNLVHLLPKCEIEWINKQRSSTYKYQEFLEDAYSSYHRCVLFNLIEKAPEIAIKYLNKALQMKPDFAEAYITRGNCRWILGDNQGAIEDYNQALRIYPKFAGAYNGRGRVRAKLGEHQEAIADYTQAIYINPNRAEFYNNLGVELSRFGS